MSVQALSAAFAMEIESPTVKLVLLALANYADADFRCWPSQKTLQKLTSLSERSIRNALEVLESDGLITKTVRRRPDGSRATDIIGLAFLQSAPHAGSDQAASVAGSTTGTSCRNNRQMAPEQPAPPAPLTTFEPSREPSSLSAGALAEQNRQVAEAAGDAAANFAICPGIATLAPLRALLRGAAPCDWELDVLPAVASAAAWHRGKSGPGSMTSWTTAARMAVENRDRRLAGAGPAKTPAPARGGVAEWDDDTWRIAIRNWRADPSRWTPAMGPKPGEPDCLAPRHLIEKAA